MIATDQGIPYLQIKISPGDNLWIKHASGQSEMIARFVSKIDF